MLFLVLLCCRSSSSSVSCCFSFSCSWLMLFWSLASSLLYFAVAVITAGVDAAVLLLSFVICASVYFV